MTDSPGKAPAPSDWDRLAELHARASEADPVGRSALLRELRATRPDLAAELAAMLDATPTAAALALEDRLGTYDGSGGLGAAPEIATLAPGDRVGPWRVVSLLARGGMGEVHLAERADGEVEQRVALKLLRSGIATTDLLERFRLERSLLARLEHPAITPLLDAGTTADGKPYLALRYVDGLPITRWAIERRLPPRDRARLFVELCRAVQFAHGNLVVHRDLKPSNVLVDASGRVHLLDFGIAKLLAPDGGDTEPTRALELAPMTPQRAAPEQRRGEPVSTATDVWALGLLLHELVTGELPLTGLDDDVATVKRGGALDRDLAAVVGRALAAEPGRRYASAGALADDVERWIAGEPVKARPDSLAYRVTRFVRRHRLAVGAAAAAAALLLVSTLVAVSRSREAARQRAAATASAGEAEAVVDLVVDLLGGLDPIAGADLDTVRVSDLVRRGEEEAAQLEAQPVVQARLRHVLGRIQLERSDWKSALALLTAARDAERARVGPHDAAIVPLEIDYARALHSTGKHDAAVAEAREALARVEADPRVDAATRQSALVTLGAYEADAGGEARVREGIAILRAHPEIDRAELAAALTSFAFLRQMAGDVAGTRAAFAEALAIVRARRGDRHPHTFALESNLASLLEEPAERLAAHRRILAARRELLGDRHYTVANSWIAVGRAELDLGDAAAALAAFEQADSIWSETAGRESRMATAARSLAEKARARLAGAKPT